MNQPMKAQSSGHVICLDQWEASIPPVPVGELREPPDIADAHAEPDAGEDELPLAAPVLPGLVAALSVRLGESWNYSTFIFFVR